MGKWDAGIVRIRRYHLDIIGPFVSAYAKAFFPYVTKGMSTYAKQFGGSLKRTLRSRTPQKDARPMFHKWIMRVTKRVGEGVRFGRAGIVLSGGLN